MGEVTCHWSFNLPCGTVDGAKWLYTAAEWLELHGADLVGSKKKPIVPKDVVAAAIIEAAVGNGGMELFDTSIGQWQHKALDVLQFASTDESHNPDGLCRLVQAAQKVLKGVPDPFYLECAYTCSTPEPDCFGGAMYRITKDKIDVWSTAEAFHEDHEPKEPEESGDSEKVLPINVIVQVDPPQRGKSNVDIGVEGPGGQMVVRSGVIASEGTESATPSVMHSEMMVYATQLAYCLHGAVQLGEVKKIPMQTKDFTFVDYAKFSGTQKVWVLHITHKHGEDITVYSSFDLALSAAAEFAEEWWGDVWNETNTTKKPKDKQEMVDLYFDKMQDSEWYSIEESVVNS